MSYLQLEYSNSFLYLTFDQLPTFELLDSYPVLVSLSYFSCNSCITTPYILCEIASFFPHKDSFIHLVYSLVFEYNHRRNLGYNTNEWNGVE